MWRKHCCNAILFPKCWGVWPRAQHLWRTQKIFLKLFTPETLFVAVRRATMLLRFGGVCHWKGPVKRGHNVAETLLQRDIVSKMLRRLATRATFVTDTKNLSETLHTSWGVTDPSMMDWQLLQTFRKRINCYRLNIGLSPQRTSRPQTCYARRAPTEVFQRPF